jgi:hypothetical protein
VPFLFGTRSEHHDYLRIEVDDALAIAEPSLEWQKALTNLASIASTDEVASRLSRPGEMLDRKAAAQWKSAVTAA